MAAFHGELVNTENGGRMNIRYAMMNLTAHTAQKQLLNIMKKLLRRNYLHYPRSMRLYLATLWTMYAALLLRMVKYPHLRHGDDREAVKLVGIEMTRRRDVIRAWHETKDFDRPDNDPADDLFDSPDEESASAGKTGMQIEGRHS